MLSRRLLTFSRWNKVPISVKPVKNNLLSAAKVEPKYTGSINPIIPSDTGSLEEVKIDWILPRDEKDTSSGSLYQIVANDPKYSGSANLILPSDMGSHVSPNLILSSDKVSLEEEKINWILPKDEKDTSSGSDWLMPFLTIGAGAVVIGASSDEEDGKPGRLFNERLCMPHLFEKKQKEMEEEWIRKEQQAQQALDKKLKEMEQEWIRKEQQAQQALDKKLEENQRMFEKKQMKKKQEIREGSSISSVTHSFEGLNFNVKFKLEIENYSDQHLTRHQWKVHTGQVSSPHVPVKPGMKEAMSGHKTGDTATGCVGTVSWKIGDTNKMLVVMYSVPYSHDFHSNWLGVGIFNLADTSNHYNKMYYETEDFFKRKEFYYNVDPVVYQDANYRVTANMGTTHKPIIQVQLKENERMFEMKQKEMEQEQARERANLQAQFAQQQAQERERQQAQVEQQQAQERERANQAAQFEKQQAKERERANQQAQENQRIFEQKQKEKEEEHERKRNRQREEEKPKKGFWQRVGEIFDIILTGK